MDQSAIRGLHHITLCTGTAQGDVDFFVKVMGQRLIKRTLFYDGRIPIYHLYFTDTEGTPGTVMTTFPMRRTKLIGRKGSGQFTSIAYAVPRGSLEFKADPESPGHDKNFSKDRPVILHCASGGRAALAGKLLKDMGYQKVYNLGGFKDWAEAGGKVEK